MPKAVPSQDERHLELSFSASLPSGYSNPFTTTMHILIRKPLTSSKVLVLQTDIKIKDLVLIRFGQDWLIKISVQNKWYNFRAASIENEHLFSFVLQIPSSPVSLEKIEKFSKIKTAKVKLLLLSPTTCVINGDRGTIRICERLTFKSTNFPREVDLYLTVYWNHLGSLKKYPTL